MGGPAGGGGTRRTGRGHMMWGREGHVQWEQFPDLLTVVEVMLFIFGRLLMSGRASASAALGPDMHSECPAWKNLRDVPGLVVLTHSALLYNSSCGTWCLPLTLSQSVSLCLFLPPPMSPFSFYSVSLFSTSFLPSLPLQRPPSHPSLVLFPNPPVYPAHLSLFLFCSVGFWRTAIHEQLAACWQMFQPLMY